MDDPIAFNRPPQCISILSSHELELDLDVSTGDDLMAGCSSANATLKYGSLLKEIIPVRHVHVKISIFKTRFNLIFNTLGLLTVHREPWPAKFILAG